MSDNSTPAADNGSQATPNPNTYALESPIVRGEQRIDAVTLRKPAAGELRGVALADLLRLDVAALIVVLPRITTPALTQHDVSQLDLVDLVSLGGGVAGFFMSKAERALLAGTPTE